jgi:glutamine synthetase
MDESIVTTLATLVQGCGLRSAADQPWLQGPWQDLPAHPAKCGIMCAAISALKGDHGLLLQGDVFRQALIDLWVQARERDALEVSFRPHPYELELYFDL